MKKVYFFIGIFFHQTNELALCLEFIKKKLGDYKHFSHNINYKTFPLADELFSVFYTGRSISLKEQYKSKIIALSKPIKLKKIPLYVKKVTKFQKKIWNSEYSQIPIQMGYIYKSRVISIYPEANGNFGVPDNSGFYHQTELISHRKSLIPYQNTLSLFKHKTYMVFFNDLNRIIN